MLRVGLTGGLGSGKSTVASMLRAHGAQILEADALGRELMEPGHAVYTQIVERFGPEVVLADGRLNRAKLAEIAFGQGRVQELNAIVHPAVIDLQRAMMDAIFAKDPAAIAVLESALIFEVVRDARARGETEGVLADWRRRIDSVIVVTAPDEIKIARYAARIATGGQPMEAAMADARTRLSHQIPDAEKAAQADYVIDNSGDRDSLKRQVEAIWLRLKTENSADSNKS